MLQEYEPPPPNMRNLRAIHTMVSWWLSGVWLTLTRQMTPALYAKRLRNLIERLGGLWLQIGHLLALRVDVLSREVAGELAEMKDGQKGFAFFQVKKIVEAELGQPMEEVFETFQEKPFAPKVGGQLHSATLKREGIRVAVKVQRPYIEEIYKQDLAAIRFAVRISSYLNLWPHLRLEEMAWELEQTVRESLDYRFEAAQAREMKESLQEHGVRIPKVITRYCSKRIMVQQFFRASLMADYVRKRRTDPEKARLWLLENGIERKKLGKRLLDSLMRQIFEENNYHGDLNPAHIVLFRDSEFGFVDFASCSFTEVEYLNRFRLFMRSLATRDYAKAADLCFLLCAFLPPIDMEMVKDEVIQALRAWAVRTNVPELPYSEKSLHNATLEVVRVLWRHRCAMSWTFMRIRQAITTLDESLSVLVPDINYTEYLNKYFRKADGRSMRAFVKRNPLAQAVNAVATTIQIQDRINEYTMFQGSLMRRHAQVFQGRTNKVAFVLGTLAGQMATFCFVLFGVMGIAYLGQHRPDILLQYASADYLAVSKIIPRLDRATWALAAVLNLYLLRGFWRLRSRLSQAEIRADE